MAVARSFRRSAEGAGYAPARGQMPIRRDNLAQKMSRSITKK